MDYYDLYSSEDLIQGKLDDSQFYLAEVLTQIERKDNKGNTYYDTSFSGLFNDVKLLKNTNCYIKFRKDKVNRSILSKLPFFSSNDKDKIDLDSPEFEQYFDVFSDNRMLTMQILTLDIMQKIVDFKRKMAMDFEISIINQDLFIRFRCGKMFEASSVNKFSLDKDLLYKYYRILSFCLEVSDLFIKSVNEVIL